MSGRVLKEHEMLSAIVEDLNGRANNDFPQDAVVSQRLREHVTAIRRDGARSPDLTSQVEVLYNATETDAVLDGFTVGKMCTKGCYAALCAKEPNGRALSRVLVNLETNFDQFRHGTTPGCVMASAEFPTDARILWALPSGWRFGYNIPSPCCGSACADTLLPRVINLLGFP